MIQMIKTIWNSLLWYSTTGGVFVQMESLSHRSQIDNLGATQHVPHVKQGILTLLERLISPPFWFLMGSCFIRGEVNVIVVMTIGKWTSLSMKQIFNNGPYTRDGVPKCLNGWLQLTAWNRHLLVHINPSISMKSF